MTEKEMFALPFHEYIAYRTKLRLIVPRPVGYGYGVRLFVPASGDVG
jgi:hypothetical protein